MDVLPPSPEQANHDNRLMQLYEALKNGEKVGLDPETAKELEIPLGEGQSILEYLKTYFHLN